MALAVDFRYLEKRWLFCYQHFYRNQNNRSDAIDKALEVLNKLHEKGLDEKSLTSAKNYVKGQFPPRYETSAS